MKNKEAVKRAKLNRQIRLSDTRIFNALQVLGANNRGQNALAEFRRFAEGMASGLDLPGQKALKILFEEWLAGRRNFLQDISPVVLPPKPMVPNRFDGAPKCSVCGWPVSAGEDRCDRCLGIQS